HPCCFQQIDHIPVRAAGGPARLARSAGHQRSHFIEYLWRKLCETTDGLEQNAMNSLHLNSPPKLGGVAARSRKYREATFDSAAGVVLKGTTPPRARNARARHSS